MKVLVAEQSITGMQRTSCITQKDKWKTVGCQTGFYNRTDDKRVA